MSTCLPDVTVWEVDQFKAGFMALNVAKTCELPVEKNDDLEVFQLAKKTAQEVSASWNNKKISSPHPSTKSSLSTTLSEQKALPDVMRALETLQWKLKNTGVDAKEKLSQRLNNAIAKLQKTIDREKTKTSPMKADFFETLCTKLAKTIRGISDRRLKTRLENALDPNKMMPPEQLQEDLLKLKKAIADEKVTAEKDVAGNLDKFLRVIKWHIKLHTQTRGDPTQRALTENYRKDLSALVERIFTTHPELKEGAQQPDLPSL